jgi:uncharacterized protein YvpB
MIRRHFRRYWGYLAAVIILCIVATGAFFELTAKEPKVSPEKTLSSEHFDEKKTDYAPVKLIFPESYALTVPYTVQAPLTNWNIHEESCEEAAILMVHYYLIGQTVSVINPQTANQELIDMVNWQKLRYGKELDLDMTAVGELAKNYYGYKYEVKKNITADDIKSAIASGKPVMVPVITHGLQNPHYGRTPTYHILVIIGYDSTGVITNDTGVKEGRNWHYSWQVLWQAIDAQTAEMKQGRDMLTLSK